MERTYKDLLKAVIAGGKLSQDEAHWAFTQVMDGAWGEAQVAGLLVALAARGETTDEIAGAAQAMREHVRRIDTAGADVIDTCGTGGTGVSTFNVSTAAAIVAAGAGVKVAKHGNRTATRASGSADVLSALGVKIDAEEQAVQRCLAEAGVCFCFAVRCHPAMKYAAPVRKALAVRTIFNVLGPLTNPAGARRQLMGVYRPELTEPIAQVLGRLGSVQALVVHSEDGLDELSICAPTRVSELCDGAVATRTVTPRQLGIPQARMGDLLATSPEHSAQIIRGVLAGDKGPCRDMVLANAAAAVYVAGRCASIEAGVPIAERSIDSGAAKATLEKLVTLSNS